MRILSVGTLCKVGRQLRAQCSETEHLYVLRCASCVCMCTRNASSQHHASSVCHLSPTPYHFLIIAVTFMLLRVS